MRLKSEGAGSFERASYIRARPRFHRGVEEPPFALWHGAYAGFSAAAHTHAFVQVVLPLVGRMRVSIPATAQEHVLGPEQAVILPADVAHGFTYLDGELEFLALDAPAGWPVPLTSPAVVRAPGAWLMARALAEEVDRPGPETARLLTIGREALALYLARALAGPRPVDAADDERTRRVLQAVDRILRDYATPLTVEGLAADLAMSPRHFERCFKAAVGTSPRRFLIEVRLRAARELLETTGLPIAFVGEAVGFATPAHFADTFARAAGVSPGVWRKERRP